MILGDTKESLSAKTNRPLDDIYDDEVDAVVIHGDTIDSLQGWQWDQSRCKENFEYQFMSSLFFLIVFNKKEIVFARTSPQHKLEIGRFQAVIRIPIESSNLPFAVKHAQALGHIVGV